jgi:antitoxin VapB
MTTAKLFMNGRSQAVRLPREYRFEDQEEVLIKRMGDMVVLIPKSKWEDVYLDGIRSFSSDIEFDREQQIEERDISL